MNRIPSDKRPELHSADVHAVLFQHKHCILRLNLQLNRQQTPCNEGCKIGNAIRYKERQAYKTTVDVLVSVTK